MQTLFRVSSNRRGIERFESGAWVPHDGAIPKEAHWITEPAASSGEANDMKRIGLFNRIADARERSPLVRAAGVDHEPEGRRHTACVHAAPLPRCH